jgi:hypothetical protein
MVKLLTGAQDCKQIDIGDRRYTADRKGQFDVEDRHVKAMMQGAECFRPTQTLASKTRGWRCDKCNWSALINHCSKCGSTKLERER